MNYNLLFNNILAPISIILSMTLYTYLIFKVFELSAHMHQKSDKGIPIKKTIKRSSGILLDENTREKNIMEALNELKK